MDINQPELTRAGHTRAETPSVTLTNPVECHRIGFADFTTDAPQGERELRMRKVTYWNDVAAPEIETPPPERLPPVGYFAKGAILIGAFVFVALAALMTIFNVNLMVTLKISVAVSVAAMTGYGVYSLALFTTFDWREAEPAW